jgi:hypothetical protein
MVEGEEEVGGEVTLEDREAAVASTEALEEDMECQMDSQDKKENLTLLENLKIKR